MSILTMPASPRFAACRLVLQAANSLLVSPITKSEQTLQYLGGRWLGTYELPVMTAAQANAWTLFLCRLNGRAGRFYCGPVDITAPRGTATGSPLVKGASQTGNYLTTDGWTNNITGILCAGDYIAWNTPSGWRELHKLVVDANSDGSGNATLEVVPEIRESPADNATIITASPTAVMMLTNPLDACWDIEPGYFHRIAFGAEEAFGDTY